MTRDDSVRVRVAVYDDGAHTGYLTTIGYPDCGAGDLPGGVPVGDLVVSDLRDGHVALVRQYRKHWLVYCGPRYDTTDAGGGLSPRHALELARLALCHRDAPAAVRIGALKAYIEGVLRGGQKS